MPKSARNNSRGIKYYSVRIEELGEVDTSAVEPLASVTGHSLPLRADKVTDGNKVDDILANAPEQASGFFVVPKVVE